MGIKPDQLIVVIQSGPEDLSLLVSGLHATGANNPIKHLRSGKEALGYLCPRGVWRDASRTSTPALILLDCQLLDMDGKGLLFMLRQMPSLKTIPIVVFTSTAIQEEANECYTLGANSCIQKFHTAAEYVPIVSRLLDYWSQVIIAHQPGVSMAST